MYKRKENLSYFDRALTGRDIPAMVVFLGLVVIFSCITSSLVVEGLDSAPQQPAMKWAVIATISLPIAIVGTWRITAMHMEKTIRREAFERTWRELARRHTKRMRERGDAYLSGAAKSLDLFGEFTASFPGANCAKCKNRRQS